MLDNVEWLDFTAGVGSAAFGAFAADSLVGDPLLGIGLVLVATGFLGRGGSSADAEGSE